MKSYEALVPEMEKIQQQIIESKNECKNTLKEAKHPRKEFKFTAGIFKAALAEGSEKMHDTAMIYGKHFFSTYLEDATGLKIVDIGAQDVNGSLRSVAPMNNDYIGVDFAEGKGVDVLLTDPYVLPFEDSSIDVIVSSSCYEHSEFFWLSFNEALRVLKPTGLLYINAPSNGAYHRYPVDCWRFYPDSGVALQNWGNRSGYECAPLESFVGVRKNDIWHDFIGVFVKDKNHSSKFTKRIQDNTKEFMNGRLLDSENIFKHRSYPQTLKVKDLKRLFT